MHPFKLGVHEAEFHVDLFIQPKVWEDFLTRDGASTVSGLWTDRLLAPGKKMPMAGHWSFDTSDIAAGQLLSTSLSARLQELTDFEDPSNLLAYARTLTPPYPGRKISVRQEVAIPALLASLGHSDELEQRLQILSQDRSDGWLQFDTEFVGFIRGWLLREFP